MKGVNRGRVHRVQKRRKQYAIIIALLRVEFANAYPIRRGACIGVDAEEHVIATMLSAHLQVHFGELPPERVLLPLGRAKRGSVGRNEGKRCSAPIDAPRDCDDPRRALQEGG